MFHSLINNGIVVVWAGERREWGGGEGGKEAGGGGGGELSGASGISRCRWFESIVCGSDNSGSRCSRRRRS